MTWVLTLDFLQFTTEQLIVDETFQPFVQFLSHIFAFVSLDFYLFITSK